MGGSVAQCHDFGMRLTGTLGGALAQHLAVGRGDDTTHAGIRGGDEQALRGQCQRLLHEGFVCDHQCA